MKSCLTCQQVKVEQASSVGLMGHRITDGPWIVVAADIMSPLPRSKAGFAYIFVIQHIFTKWVECRALRTASGKNISEALEDLVISRWGTPQFLLTDNGTKFVNRTLKEFAESHGIKHTTVPPYHPQANPVERVNRILKTMIIAFLDRDHREWDLHLRDFCIAYNTAHYLSTGASPAFLNLGRELLPLRSLRNCLTHVNEVAEQPPANWRERMTKLSALNEWVTENLEKAYQRQSEAYNLRHRDVSYKVGDLVWKRNRILSSAMQNIAAKLAPKCQGPHRISKKVSSVVYELVSLDNLPLGRVHIVTSREVEDAAREGRRGDSILFYILYYL